MPATIRLLYVLSLASALICAAVHVSTFFGYSYPLILVFLPLLFIVWPSIVWMWRRMPKKNMISEIFGQIPRWMKVSTVALFVYFFANMLICRSLNDAAYPVQLPDGRLVLQAGKQIVRVLGADDYAWAQAYSTRLITGQLLVFYGLAVLAIKAIWIKSGPAMADAKVDGQ